MSAFRIGMEFTELTGRIRGAAAERDGRHRGTPKAAAAAAAAAPAAAVQKAQEAPLPPAFLQILDRLTKWIPAESLSLYLPGITLLRSGDPKAEPALWFLVLMIAITPVWVLLGAFGGRRKKQVESLGAAWSAALRETWLPAVLAGVAFSVWSFSVPFNGWQAIPLIREQSGAVAVIAAVAGLAFGQLAEALTTKAAIGAKE